MDTTARRNHAGPTAQGLDHLTHLRADGRYPGAHDLLADLGALARAAQRRAAGAERAPWGFCHGELHPSAVHISHCGRHVIDFAMAITGPGLFDLAGWTGLRRPPNPALTRHLIDLYVNSGGHPDALTDRAGLPAERWALGWHRIHAATWLLRCATTGIDTPDTDLHHLPVLRRQLTSARTLLDA
jgi:Phosphotransferase enzyme family